MGAVVQVDKSGDNLQKFFTSKVDHEELLGNIGVLVVSQTRERLETTKADPSGNKWVAWSEKYAKKRHSGQSLLSNEGDLIQSIAFNVHGDELMVGSDLIYAGTHQYGNPKKNIPQREYLGLSTENEAEIEDELKKYLEGILYE